MSETTHQPSLFNEPVNNQKWLIRTFDHIIVGPISKEHLKNLIQKGELAPEDEICPGNGFWVYLNDADEIKNIFDVTLPDTDDHTDEISATETEIIPTGVTLKIQEEKNGPKRFNTAPSYSPEEKNTLDRIHHMRVEQKKPWTQWDHWKSRIFDSFFDEFFKWKSLTLIIIILTVFLFFMLMKKISF